MTKEIKNVECPRCGARLKISIKTGTDLSRIGLTCPVCKVKSMLSEYKIEGGAPQLPPVPPVPNENEFGKGTCYGPEFGGTQYAPGFNSAQGIEGTVMDARLGELRLPSGQRFTLKPGRNVIGRMASSSNATIQIPTGESRRMGREHLEIDVAGNPSSGYIYVASLVKQQSNYTAIDNQQIKFGDKVYLQHGSVISLPDAELIFELS